MKSILTVFTIALVTSLSAQNLNDSLIALYTFTGNADDASGNNYHLTVKNAILTADRKGQPNAAYLLNGSNAYIGMTGASQFYLDEYSYSCWFRIDALPNSGTTQAIMSIGGDIKDNGFNLSNKYVGIYSGVGSWTYHKNAQKTSSVSQSTFNDANWHQIVATRDTDSIKFYLDGIHIGSDFTGDGAGYTGGGLGFYIGCRTGNTLFFKGVVDDVRIWKRALGAGEVAQLYNNTATSIGVQAPAIQSAIYPNPSKGAINVHVLDFNYPLQLKIHNSLGQLVSKVQLVGEFQECQIEKSGIYFMTISSTSGEKLATHKVVIE